MRKGSANANGLGLDDELEDAAGTVLAVAGRVSAFKRCNVHFYAKAPSEITVCKRKHKRESNCCTWALTEDVRAMHYHNDYKDD